MHVFTRYLLLVRVLVAADVLERDFVIDAVGVRVLVAAAVFVRVFVCVAVGDLAGELVLKSVG